MHMLSNTSTEFKPLSFNHGLNSASANDVIKRLIWGGAGGITLLPLFQVEKELFQAIQTEVMQVLSRPGQELDGSHPTVIYVSNQDKAWKPSVGAVRQYSLYNSQNDFLYNKDDHQWSDARRSFHSSLTAIPSFVNRYFGQTELQNFRLNSLTKDGGLGQHREKIIGIPGREDHYKLRFHLPIVTNPKVIFYMDGQACTMEEGRVYLFNQSSLHGVNNAGEALRAHLVWDCYLNDHIVHDMVLPALARATNPS